MLHGIYIYRGGRKDAAEERGVLKRTAARDSRFSRRPSDRDK